LASVDQPFSTDTDQNSAPGPQSGQGNVQPQLSGGSAVGGGAGSQGAAPAGSDTRSGGAATQQGTSNPGAFPNLSQYMTANSGWNQSTGGLGGAVASNLNQGTNQVQQSTQNANNAFGNQGNTWSTNAQNTENQFATGIANPYAYQQGTSVGPNNQPSGGGQAAPGSGSFSPGGGSGGVPSSFGNNTATPAASQPNAMQQANQALNQAYTGPQSLAQSNPNLAGQASSNAQNAQQGQTEGGRFNMLQQMFGGQGNYNAGEQTLDNALLQGSQSNMAQIQGATQKATQAQQGYQNANNAASNAAAGWTGEGQQLQGQAQQALNTEIGNVSNQMATGYAGAQANQANQISQDTAALNSGSITPALAAQLGITAPISNTYGVQAGSYLTNPTLTEGNTATAADYQNIGALQALGGMGQGAITAPNTSFLSQYASQPGTLYNPGNAVGYNNAGLTSAVTQNQNAYTNAINNYLNSTFGANEIGTYSTSENTANIKGLDPNNLNSTTAFDPNGANGMVNAAGLASALQSSDYNYGNASNGDVTYSHNAGTGGGEAAIQAALNSINAQYGGGQGLNAGATPYSPTGLGPQMIMNQGGEVPKLRSMMSR
jgi:hypothetical protein